jgi:hypothetical protein
MEDVLEWAKRQREHWNKALGLMERGLVGTHEGHRDTTVETKEDLAIRVAELDALISKYEDR